LNDNKTPTSRADARAARGPSKLITLAVSEQAQLRLAHKRAVEAEELAAKANRDRLAGKGPGSPTVTASRGRGAANWPFKLP
jgi:hypothetical protein